MKRLISMKRTKAQLMATCTCAALIFASVAAEAQSSETGANRVSEFAISAQPLSSALLQYGEQSSLYFALGGVDISGVESSGVSGRMRNEDALKALLASAGYTYEFISDDEVKIMRSSGGQEGASSEQSSNENTFVLEEIIVTAEKRAESLQNIPIAISAYTQDMMKRAGVKDLHDLKQLAPSLQFGARHNPQISMRGVGQELANIGAEAGVTVSENGVPFVSTFMFDAELLDVERVEVLRGPQGTINGRNATGGAINIYSRKPTEDFEGSIAATIGNYDRFATEGYLSGPIGDSGVLGRLAFRTDRADGYIKNTLLDTRLYPTDETQARASFLTNLGETLEVFLTLEARVNRSRGAHVETGRMRPDTPSRSEAAGFSGSDLEALEVELNHDRNPRDETYKANLKLTWDINPSSSLTSTTGYAKYAMKTLDADSDGSAVEAVAFDVAINVWQVSQELTLAADITDRLDMILGGLYLKSGSDQPLDYGLPSSGYPVGSIFLSQNMDLSSWALYTQWRYRLTDTLRISLGGRYTRDAKDVQDTRIVLGSGADVGDSGTWGAFTPRIAIDYTPTDSITVYASASRGFKAGGYNTYGVGSDGGPDKFDPEFVWSYEAGVKADWFDKRARTTLSAFYMEYTDFQATVVRPSILIPGQFDAQVENASKAIIKGVELELEAWITEAFRLAASGTLLDAAFDEFESVDQIFPELNDPVTGLRDMAGNQLPLAPEFQFAVSGEYTVPLGESFIGIFRADYQWQDTVYFDFFNYETLAHDAYGLLNLSALLETEDGNWKVSAFARNILDKRYLTTESRSGPSTIGFVGAPRTYGVSLSYNF